MEHSKERSLSEPKNIIFIHKVLVKLTVFFILRSKTSPSHLINIGIHATKTTFGDELYTEQVTYARDIIVSIII